MWIRTQESCMLFNLDKVNCIYAVNGNVFLGNDVNETNHRLLGSYSQQRALEVLDEIQERIANQDIDKDRLIDRYIKENIEIGNMTQKLYDISCVYVMPKE